jgi:nucleoside-diphosphate-sugar epimerase
VLEEIQNVLKGSAGAIFCIGSEQQSISTINFMVSSALLVLHAARAIQQMNADEEPFPLVLTSSTGSTNQPDFDVKRFYKNELLQWSDPQKQLDDGRFSPCAKTLMELEALKYCGRDSKNDPVYSQVPTIRLSILNPSLVLGNVLKPGIIEAAGMSYFIKICKGELMRDGIPNDSMSIIHAEDLAAMHVACIENKNASGRYFAVDKSYEWRHILKAIEKEIGWRDFSMPRKNWSDGNPVTQFDNKRRDKLILAFKESCDLGTSEKWCKDFSGLMELEEIVKKTIVSLKNRGEL